MQNSRRLIEKFQNSFRLASVIWLTSFAILAQEVKPNLTTAPLSGEQIAVYRAVLEYYVKNNGTTINVADTTYTIDWFPGDSAECLKQFRFRSENSLRMVHKLPSDVAASLKIKFVDPELQNKNIEANDPQKLVMRAGQGEKVSGTQIGESVSKAFGSGMLMLSEIAFDSTHRRAVVAFGFNCGRLCGHGDTLLLKKVGHRWKVKTGCGGWVS